MNNCNCGICDMLFNCTTQGNFAICNINNTMGRVATLEMDNGKLLNTIIEDNEHMKKLYGIIENQQQENNKLTQENNRLQAIHDGYIEYTNDYKTMCVKLRQENKELKEALKESIKYINETSCGA